MRAVVAVTDNDWAAFLRDRPHLDEVNFWLPGTVGFGGSSGTIFLFKTHSSRRRGVADTMPPNRIIGGGVVSGYTRLRVSEAWRFFEEGNGVASEGDLLAAIHSHRSGQREPDPEIGCVMLHSVAFLTDAEALPAPEDFAGPIVRWKNYVDSSYLDLVVPRVFVDAGTMVSGPVFGEPRLTVPRLGQEAFKSLVLTAYHRHCAITGAKITPTLQAAHIVPVHKGGQHRLDNGLLLRSDVHTLFDKGYLGVDHKLRLQVSRRLRDDFGNGAEFYGRAGSTIDLPERRADRPSRDAVSWHMDEVFLH
ncbi:MAG: HNH endonuclease [Propionicimonas sp.]|uniref:HNH endonuclease n=1 Tax=Propionicimonas sp. TaxID=1955623 RepID=UPI003D10B6A5